MILNKLNKMAVLVACHIKDDKKRKSFIEFHQIMMQWSQRLGGYKDEFYIKKLKKTGYVRKNAR